MLRTSQALPWTGRAALLAAAVFLVPLALDLWGGRYIGSGDTIPSELLPIAIIEHRALTFDAFVRPGEPLPYWFRVKNGRVVSDYPILPGLLNVPVFAAAKAAGVPLYENRFHLSLLTAAALASFSVLFLFFALRRVCRSEIEAFGFALLYAAGHGGLERRGQGPVPARTLALLPDARALAAPRRSAVGDGVAGLALGLAIANPADERC